MSQRGRNGPNSKSLKLAESISSNHRRRRECVLYGGRGQLFIVKAPEEIKMRKSEKTEAKDARSSRRGNIRPVNSSVSKG
jgi:hypothetical protein